jgi:uncharacterized protein (DUF58 family)
MSLLSAERSRQLDTLALGGSVGRPMSHAAGARVARARGAGAEFHEYLAYQPGDDPRAIDWTIHARLRQLVVRTRRADAVLRAHLLIDTSASMNAGGVDKLASASGLAAALAYVAVRQRDAVGLAFFDEAVTTRVAPAPGSAQLQQIMRLLEDTRAGGRSDITRALIDYANTVSSPGLVVVISDFFQNADLRGALRYLLHRGFTPAVIQIVSADEIDPPLDDQIELIDAEDPDGSTYIVHASVVEAYRARMLAWSADLGEFCAARGAVWLRLVIPCSFERVIEQCVRAGLLSGQG